MKKHYFQFDIDKYKKLIKCDIESDYSGNIIHALNIIIRKDLPVIDKTHIDKCTKYRNLLFENYDNPSPILLEASKNILNLYLNE
jgi:predicted ATPase